MKIIFISLISFIGLSILHTSCSKTESIASSEHFFEAEINGKKFRTEGLTSYAITLSDKVTVYGAKDLETVENIYIELPENFTKGTYSFSEDTFGYYILNDDAYSSLLNGGSGSITVEHWDGTYLKGYFSFNAINFEDASDRVIIENGKFDVKMR